VPTSAPLPRRNLARRDLLRLAAGTAGAAALGGLAACTAADPVPAPDPVADALGRLLAGEEAMVARYAQVIDRFPALARRLTGVRADHTAHAQALRDVLAARRGTVPAPSASASAAPAASPRPVPSTVAAALADLTRAEVAAAAAATAACLLGEGDTAALLASVAACESSHLVVLR
jgi:hypothetical protein